MTFSPPYFTFWYYFSKISYFPIESHDNMKRNGIKYTSSQCIHCVNFFSAKFINKNIPLDNVWEILKAYWTYM